MDEKSIRKYASLMRELDLTGLEVTEHGGTLRLERNAVQTAPAAGTAPVPDAPPAAETVSAAPGLIDVRSPMVGVFFSAPAENADPFVRVGEPVHKGDVLCIIEAMKLMNEITSDYDGVLAESCVANGQVVDFGHVMFRIRREQE